MKRMMQIGCFVMICPQLFAIEQPNTQKITIVPGVSKDSAKQNNVVLFKRTLEWLKQFLISREILGLSTLCFVIKYIIDTKAAQKDLDSTNKKLDDVERHGLENKKSLDDISKNQIKLSELLTAMQDKIGIIDQNAQNLTKSITDLQTTAKNTKKSTKLLEEKTGSMQSIITTISEQVSLIQIDLSTAREKISQSLLEIHVLKTLDEEQKTLLSSLHEVMKNNVIEVETLQKNIANLHEQHQKTENGFQLIQENLQKTNEKIENAKLSNEVIKERLSTQYETVHKENTALQKTLQEVQTVVSGIYHSLQQGNETSS